MNYSALFTITARTEPAYSTAQSFLANECPVLEQRLKKAALTASINILQLGLAAIDWVIDEFEKTPEYVLKVRIAQIETKRFVIRQLIKVAQLDERYQLTATARKLWTRKGAIAVTALDKVFALNWHPQQSGP